MKYCIATLLCLMICTAQNAHGKNRRHRGDRGDPRTEVGLMNNVLGCLKYKDTATYYNLFPPFDTLWRMVMHNPDHSPEAIKELAHLKDNPEALLEFDPHYNTSIMSHFCHVLQKGEDSGIHWDQVVMQRYELYKEPNNSQALVGYELVAPERFKGYMFVRDLLGRLTFCITITEIQKIEGFYFGGQVLNILEASSVDDYMKKDNYEKRYFQTIEENERADSLHQDSLKNGLLDTVAAVKDTAVKKVNLLAIAPPPADDDKSKNREEVIDRKYYEGKFDEEIPVCLFVRYMKSPKTDEITYDGLYRFGDQVNYVKLNITKNKEGHWIMEDDPPVGVLDLELKDKVYTGSWTNVESQDGYDAELKQTDIKQRKLEQLEKMLETGRVGSVDEDFIQMKKAKPKPKEDENNDEGY